MTGRAADGGLKMIRQKQKQLFLGWKRAPQVTLIRGAASKSIRLWALAPAFAWIFRPLPPRRCRRRRVLQCSLTEILNDRHNGTQECRGWCLTFLQKAAAPLQSHQRCISEASLEAESDCRKGIFATLTLTLPASK